MDMDAIKAAYACLYQHYPQLATAILQVVGAASVLYRVVSHKSVQGATGSVLGTAMKFLGKAALNPPHEAP